MTITTSFGSVKNRIMKEYWAIDQEDNIELFVRNIQAQVAEGWTVLSSNAYMKHNRSYYYAMLVRENSES